MNRETHNVRFLVSVLLVLVVLTGLFGCSATPTLERSPDSGSNDKKTRKRHLREGRQLLNRKQYIRAWNEFYQIKHVSGLVTSILFASRSDVPSEQVNEMLRRTAELDKLPESEDRAKLKQIGMGKLKEDQYELAWWYFDIAGYESGKEQIRNELEQQDRSPSWLKGNTEHTR